MRERPSGWNSSTPPSCATASSSYGTWVRGMALPRRKPNRLPNYDYSQAGYYFITLCTKDKQPLFWQPSVGADIICPPQGIQLSSIGRVVDEAIRAIPAHYPMLRWINSSSCPIIFT